MTDSAKHDKEKVSVAARIEMLTKKMSHHSSELKNIYSQAKSAKANPEQFFIFKGMYKDLKATYTSFTEYWEEIKEMYAKTSRTPPFPNDEEKAAYESAKYGYVFSNAVYEHYMNPTPENPKTAPPSQPGMSTMLNSTLDGSRVYHTRLPEIKLPKFDGDLANWVHFRDTYKSLIHESTSLSPMEKYHYLVGSTSGTAKSILKSIPFLEENYEQAFKALLDNFDSKRRLASNYLKSVFEFKPLMGKPTLTTLKHFLNVVGENITAFKMLQIADSAEFILFSLAIRCLDPVTRIEFEKAHDQVEFPTITALVNHVKRECRSFELTTDVPIEMPVPQASKIRPLRSLGNTKSAFFSEKTSAQHITQTKTLPPNHNRTNNWPKRIQCVVCHLHHNLYNCPKFREAEPVERVTMLKNWNGCDNCLSYEHILKNCPSSGTCRICQQRHHTMLHVDCSTSSGSQLHQQSSQSTSRAVSLGGTSNDGEVLLGTALASIKDSRGHFQPIRMVLDSGSQHSFLTHQCALRLGLRAQPCLQNVSGIGQTVLHGLKGKVLCVIRPFTKYAVQLSTDALVVTSITNELPHSKVPSSFVSRCESYSLADPNFGKPGPIDFLLGADLFYDVVCGAPFVIGSGQPKLTPTIFGHIVAGRSDGSQASSTFSLLVANSDLSSVMKKFWETEEIETPVPPSKEDRLCEMHFQTTHSRLPSGRYVVSLPLKTPHPDLSQSRHQAYCRFMNLESKLRRQPALKTEYSKFMKEYLDLGHMKLASQPGKYFIPHHPVMKFDGSKLKLRVVFDASCSTSNGSLNDFLMAGPKLQLEIADILLNFRLYVVVVVSDIIKMFRQMNITSSDCSYQHILWRFEPDEPLQEYELSTVTYGLASSPYLALRVIRQLVHDEGAAFPLAAKALTSEIYVDDILAGSDSLQGALELQQELVSLLGKGCFELSKWMSNRPELLHSKCVAQDSYYQVEPCAVSPVKILGLQYCPEHDYFAYAIEIPHRRPTKRAILSAIARIYDPLGYLAPVVFFAKSILQETWLSKYDWDQLIAEPIAGTWAAFLNELPSLSSIKIPRLIPALRANNLQLIGFCDASSKGYASAIYLRTATQDYVRVFLLKAKTKLAPLKTTTIPRLELGGALLLARLIKSVKPFTKKLSITSSCLFTDSTIVLGWLKMDTNLLKSYVAHRVVEINETLPSSNWCHIRSEDNPVDCASRGVSPANLESNSLWWSGPQWLKLSPESWPTLKPPPPSLTHQDPEVKAVSEALLSHGTPSFVKFLEHFSSYSRLLRSAAVLRRFCKWLRTKEKAAAPISVAELRECHNALVKATQAHHLLANRSLDHLKASKAFGRLDPFFDSGGIVRVGGRLGNSYLPFGQKHPILLPGKCHFTHLLIDHYHVSNLHLSATLLQNTLQTQYWIVSARSAIKQRVHKCLKCRKANPRPIAPQMGNLPESRFTEGKAFTNVGVDYGGPFTIRASLRRNASHSKAYLCLFICMATKALHLELVSSGTTEAFLAALDRFVARRGKPSRLRSDCGRNFVGASRELRETVAWLNDLQAKNQIHKHLSIQGIDWTFNPPLSPHFGGLWEAGIKSVKGILKRVVSQTPFTFEELATIFARVEAILNSRPLCPLVSDPTSLDVLTPGHFLIGGPLIAAPEIDLLELQENTLSRWQLVTQRIQHYWKRWRNEYLTTLQQRPKWQKKSRNLAVGDLVLLRDPATPPTQWPTARIQEVHPGNDGTVRVITVRTSSGVYQRSVANVVPLYPIIPNDHDSI